uniref:Uncharacterized protein n=1 Tax=Timema genevievae TaxID=629358 RepID=A0A7R9KA04_TIMGE|nr:unnamed protein product [Timema genevievae]
MVFSSGTFFRAPDSLKEYSTNSCILSNSSVIPLSGAKEDYGNGAGYDVEAEVGGVRTHEKCKEDSNTEHDLTVYSDCTTGLQFRYLLVVDRGDGCRTSDSYPGYNPGQVQERNLLKKRKHVYLVSAQEKVSTRSRQGAQPGAFLVNDGDGSSVGAVVQGVGLLKENMFLAHLTVFVILTNRLLAKFQLVLYLFPGLPISLRHQKPDEEDPKEHTDTVGAVSHRETHDVDHVGETFGDQEHEDPVKTDRAAGDEASGLTRSKFGHHQPGQGPHAELETDHKHVECQERHPAVLTHVDLRLVEVRVDGHGRQTYGQAGTGEKEQGSPTRVVDHPGRGESSHQLHEGYYNGAEVRRQGGARVAENVDGVVHEGAGAAHLLQEHEPEYYVGSFERRGRGGDALNALPNLLEQRGLVLRVFGLLRFLNESIYGLEFFFYLGVVLVARSSEPS